MHHLIAILFMLTISYTTHAQYFSNSRLNSLTIYENDSITYMGDTLVIDSLIMEDNSTLLFQKNAFVIVKNSFIGNGALISSAGSNGRDGRNVLFKFGHATNGKDGIPGKDLTLFINFNELGSLTITTQGGNGGNGGNGYYEGKSGISGDGASGGKLSVYYTYDDFIPRFNRQIPGPHSVHLLADAGSCGNTGKASYKRVRRKRYAATRNRYTSGQDRPQTFECYSGMDGLITLKKVIYN